MGTTNEELASQIKILEAKVDMMASRMDQAMGAWFFVKLMASIAFGCVMAWSTLKSWFS